jgi:acyl-CoA thioesterase I
MSVKRPRRAWFFTIACAAMLSAAPLAAGVADKPVKIVAFGDSLTAGFGLPAADAFPVKLERALNAKGQPVAVVNAGVSGDTTSGGLARVDWSVPDGTDAVILELGANDALRGIDPAVTRKALEAIIGRLKERRIAVLLCGMLAPPNMGSDYAQSFDAIFGELATANDLVFYRFFLDGVAADRNLNQGDGLHPTAAGVDVIVAGILPKVEELIARIRARRNS